MESQSAVDHFIAQIHAYQLILEGKGVFTDIPTTEQLKSMELTQLRILLRELIILARTPT